MTHNEDAPLLSPGEMVLGRYEVVHFIARGGTGEVYVALHRRLGHRVAVKVLHQRENEDIARFFAEAEAMAAVQHPGLVSIIDSGCINDLPCIVMNYIDGVALDSLLEASAPIGWNDLLHLLVPTAEALGALHDHGFVHRDIKPANVVVQPGLRPGAVLIDLSIAMNTRLDPRLLPSEQDIYGTLAYMAPEQLRGERVDMRSDVFSFGLMLYECLVGQLPLARRNRSSSFRAVARSALTPLPDVVTPPSEPPVPESLREIVRRCLEVRPEDRFVDGNMLAEALNRVGPVAAFGTDGALLLALDPDTGAPHPSTSGNDIATTLHPATRAATAQDARPEAAAPPAGADVVMRPRRDRRSPNKRSGEEDWSRPLQSSGAFVIVPATGAADERSSPYEPSAGQDQSTGPNSPAITPAPHSDPTPAVAAALTRQYHRVALRLDTDSARDHHALVGAHIPVSNPERPLLLQRLGRRAGADFVSVTDGDWWFALVSAGTGLALHQRIHALLLALQSTTEQPRSAQWARLDCGPDNPGFTASVRDALRLIRHPSDMMPRINA